MGGVAIERIDVISPLIDRLRRETRDLHESLERELDWQSRMSTLEGYQRLLARWWGFHAAFEPIIEARPPLVGLGPRRKLHLLERDLSYLGMSSTAIAGLPRIEPLTFLADRAGMIGAMYVLEGSTLGGQVIARHVRRRLSEAVSEGGCEYYECYDRNATGPMWQTFLDRLSEEVKPRSHDAVIAGARQTFAALRGWLPA